MTRCLASVNSCIMCVLFFFCFLVHFAPKGHDLHKPNVIGSATEGALVILAAEWGYNATTVKDVRNAVVFFSKLFTSRSASIYWAIDEYLFVSLFFCEINELQRNHNPNQPDPSRPSSTHPTQEKDYLDSWTFRILAKIAS